MISLDETGKQVSCGRHHQQIIATYLESTLIYVINLSTVDYLKSSQSQSDPFLDTFFVLWYTIQCTLIKRNNHQNVILDKSVILAYGNTDIFKSIYLIRIHCYFYMYTNQPNVSLCNLLQTPTFHNPVNSQWKKNPTT